MGSFVVYTALAYAYPPHKTFIERAVLPDEIYANAGYGNDENEIDGVPVEYETGGEKSKLKTLAERKL